MSVDAAKICAAFGLPEPSGPLELVQHTVSRTWRLDVRPDAYLVKEIWPGEDPFWAGEVLHRMDFELRAGRAGVRQPRPVRALPSAAFGSEASAGFGARVDGIGCYRVYEWLDRRRDLGEADDPWVAATLAVLHGLERAPGDQLRPRYYGLYDREQWKEWVHFGTANRRCWGDVAVRVADDVIRLTDELTEAYEHASDKVITHGDFVPANVICAQDGPALVDWDAVGPESALHEAGQTLFTFTGGDEARLRAGLSAYQPSVQGRYAELFDRVIGTRLANLTELLKVEVSGETTTGWKGMVEHRDQRIADELAALPEYAVDLRALSRRLLTG